MTTIATDGKVMAGDGLITGNGTVHGFNAKKVHRLDDGRIVGICGSVYNYQAFLRWVEDESQDRPSLDDESFEALVLHKDGTVKAYDGKCNWAWQEVPAVTGSGSAIALGAMLAGAKPHEAVGIASQRDTGTGGTIQIEALA